MAQFYLQMYLTAHVNFFQIYDRSSVANLCRCLELHNFKRDEVIYSPGETGDTMYVVMLGSVGLYSNLRQEQHRCTENFIFGEKGVTTENHKRDLCAKALENTYCLSLRRQDFLDHTFLFEHNQKSMRKNYIKTLPFTREWNIEKLTYFNTELSQYSIMPGEVVFDIGSQTEVFYMVKSGELQIEAEVEIEE